MLLYYFLFLQIFWGQVIIISVVRGDWVKHNIFKNEKDYLFCVEKQSKDGFYFEAKARSLHSGDFYDVRFEGKKKYLFFIFKNHQWHVYFMENDLNYHPSVFKSAEDLLRLESDIQSAAGSFCLRRKGKKVPFTRRCKNRPAGSAVSILPRSAYSGRGFSKKQVSLYRCAQISCCRAENKICQSGIGRQPVSFWMQ